MRIACTASEKMVGFRKSLSSEGSPRVNCSVAADWIAFGCLVVSK